VVTDSWKLYARRRTNNYLVEDPVRLQTKIRGGCELPAGPLALVSPPSNQPLEFEPVNFRGISTVVARIKARDPKNYISRWPITMNK